MMNATTLAIVDVERTAKPWTVEGISNAAYPDQSTATMAASFRMRQVHRSVWIRHQGERHRLLRY